MERERNVTIGKRVLKSKNNLKNHNTGEVKQDNYLSISW